MEPIKYRGFELHLACTEEPAGIWWPRVFVEGPSSSTPVSVPQFERSRKAAEDVAVGLAKAKIDRAFERRKF